MKFIFNLLKVIICVVTFASDSILSHRVDRQHTVAWNGPVVLLALFKVTPAGSDWCSSALCGTHPPPTPHGAAIQTLMFLPSADSLLTSFIDKLLSPAGMSLASHIVRFANTNTQTACASKVLNPYSTSAPNANSVLRDADAACPHACSLV